MMRRDGASTLFACSGSTAAGKRASFNDSLSVDAAAHQVTLVAGQGVRDQRRRSRG